MMGWRDTNHNGCPCGGCPDRLSGEREASCHERCDRYKAWKQKLDAMNEAERKRSSTNDLISESYKRQLWRKKRYANQGHFNKSRSE